MSNIVIARPELGDAAVITAGSAGATTPASNLQRKQPTDIWQTVDLSTAYLIIDLGSSQAINLIALLFTNATSGAIWRIRAASSEALLYTAPVYDGPTFQYLLTEAGDYLTTESGDRLLTESPGGILWCSDTLESRRHGLLFLTTPITARWIRIDITDVANPDGMFRAGRLYVSNAWQPSINMQYGWSNGWDDASPITETRGRNLIPNAKPPIPVVDFSLAFLSEDEMLTNAYEIDRVRGASKDMLVITNPDASVHLQKHMFYGLMSNGRKISNKQYALYEISYALKGLI